MAGTPVTYFFQLKFKSTKLSTIVLYFVDLNFWYRYTGNMHKNALPQAVLEKLAELGEGTLDVFFPKNYAYTAFWRPVLGLDRKKKIPRRTISTILWRLKQQGLVERTGAKKIARWRVTPEGRDYLHPSEPMQNKNRLSDGITRLVIFDIPEQERKKRDLIRAELVGCQFTQLQKSVWMGQFPLPEDFITLIDTLELNGKIHIFSVRDPGTIVEIN